MELKVLIMYGNRQVCHIIFIQGRLTICYTLFWFMSESGKNYNHWLQYRGKLFHISKVLPRVKDLDGFHKSKKCRKGSFNQNLRTIKTFVYITIIPWNALTTTLENRSIYLNLNTLTLKERLLRFHILLLLHIFKDLVLVIKVWSSQYWSSNISHHNCKSMTYLKPDC